MVYFLAEWAVLKCRDHCTFKEENSYVVWSTSIYMYGIFVHLIPCILLIIYSHLLMHELLKILTKCQTVFFFVCACVSLCLFNIAC